MIDVIIPCYNETTNLPELLDVLRPEIDKGQIKVYIAESPESTDKCDHIASQHQVTYIECPKKGRASQMNYAAFRGTSDFILFIHADVRPPVNFVTAIKASIRNGNQAGFFSYRFDSKNWMLRVNANFTKRDGYFAGGGDQCHFFSRRTFEQLGGYDESYVIMEDFHMIDRLRKLKIPYSVIPQDAIVSARKYKENSWLTVNLINLRILRLYKKGTSPIQLRKAYQKLLRENF
jgi:rSAM/selenodomain-associated transferase 2